jgi:hypothetical protein
VYESVEECMEKYQKGSGWNLVTIDESYRLLNVLNNEQFCCLLFSFYARGGYSVQRAIE